MISKDYIAHRIYKITRDEGIDLHVIGNLIRFVWEIVDSLQKEKVKS